MHHFLSEVNKWVGVVIALVGSVVVAPDGTRLLLVSSWTSLRRQGSRVRGVLSRLLPFLRSDPIAHTRTLTDIALAGDSVLTAYGRVWTPTASVDERIEALRQHINEVEGRLNGVASELQRERLSREAAITELDRMLKAETAELRRLLHEKDREAALIDARGLPVIGFGILLSGVPEALSSIPWHLGWIFPLLGVAAAVVAVVHAARERIMIKRLGS